MAIEVFTTNRFSCRRWQADDVDHVHAVYADEEGARWIDDGQPISRDDSERWMAVTAANYEQRGYGMFAIILRESAELVGFCGLVHPGGQEVAEIKYAFYRQYWGAGFASEVVPAMLAWGARERGLNRIIATVAEPNVASQRVLLKSGMRFTEALADDDHATLVFEWLPVEN